MVDIPKGEVHVWQTGLEVPAACIERLYATLSEDERQRAARYRFDRDRQHFIVARGALRGILGDYVGVDPARLRFVYTPYGKPSLDPAFDGGELRFNLSHAGGMALYAVTRGREVGIDLEPLRPESADDANTLSVARQFFSPWEVQELLTLPMELRGLAFYNCWTRKEAYIKARGEGLSLPLDQFDVSLAPGQPARLLRARDSQEATRWSLAALEPGAGYVGALVVEGPLGEIKYRQWTMPLAEGLGIWRSGRDSGRDSGRNVEGRTPAP
ncbi:MAG: 4'-phosphopantetheinyl transferase superfamily protein [Chloroflexi bacterium]|jgi:4'-phosphopantetheinyl transferase|nr:4'-phosphopantetheinyl transferase superfamily protein [Chloroflexota bacterium]